MSFPKPLKRCKKCKAVYVDDDLYKGKCPVCGTRN